MPRSAKNPPRPLGGTASLTTCLLRLKRSFSWRLRTQFSKSCLPLGYNGYFCCQYAVLPGRQRFPATPRGLPADSPGTPRGLPADSPRHPPTRSLGDKQTIENRCVYCIIATWTPRTTQLTPRTTQLTPRSFQMTPRGFQMTPRGFQMTPGSSQTTLWSSQKTSLGCNCSPGAMQ